ncbi:MAG: stage II sporulation protein M [Nanoarchaeota archaeon]|nr:stage II sporulation protein M [Nanoarchaeota archaeon]MBU1976561.1 stage II sporulation protein M [Nanoarchaeota archaeon]
MVLESLINPFTIKKKPWEMFFVGFVYSIIGLILSYLVFREIAGILTVFLIVLAALPLVYTAINNEEDLDLKTTGEFKILKEHSRVIMFLVFLFLGVTAALTFSYVFLPQGMVDNIFNLQKEAIVNVNNNVQGNVTQFDIFTRITFNNLKVLFFCLLFSLLYGTGAIFILTWNASVIAVAMGTLIKTEIANTASLMGLGLVSSYFGIATFSFLRYMSHGILEILAYFVAGFAGSIISIAIIRKNMDNEKVITDSLDLILISLGLLLVAGIIEVYLTPIFFYS